MTPSQPHESDSRTQLYVCENCGRIGPIRSFDRDCTPGWTHGRLIKVDGDASFIGLVAIARTLLREQYPEDVFGSGRLSLDAGAKFTNKLREALSMVHADD